jgi:hypothetical protein
VVKFAVIFNFFTYLKFVTIESTLQTMASSSDYLNA